MILTSILNIYSKIFFHFLVPEEPKNLTVEEYPDNSINIYWERPIVDPEYYVAELQNDENDNNVTNDMIPGVSAN